MDWNDQLRTSLIWLGKAFVVSSIGLTITIYLLAQFSEWGRLVRRISWEYFNPSRSTVPLAWLALIVLMTLFSVRLSILLSFWYNGFYSAMQKLTLGTLRSSLYYPGIPAQTDDRAAAILGRCHLGHLVARLDEENDWTRILSLGEQQRLAIGRLLLNRPRAAFLDEASSAMDEGLEHAMYRLLRESLPGATLVSVGHRSSLLGFHDRVLELLGEGKWRLQELPEAASNAARKSMLPAPGHIAAHS